MYVLSWSDTRDTKELSPNPGKYEKPSPDSAFSSKMENHFNDVSVVKLPHISYIPYSEPRKRCVPPVNYELFNASHDS